MDDLAESKPRRRDDRTERAGLHQHELIRAEPANDVCVQPVGEPRAVAPGLGVAAVAQRFLVDGELRRPAVVKQRVLQDGGGDDDGKRPMTRLGEVRDGRNEDRRCRHVRHAVADVEQRDGGDGVDLDFAAEKTEDEKGERDERQQGGKVLEDADATSRE